MLGIKSLDHVDIDRNASFVAVAGPLRILYFARSASILWHVLFVRDTTAYQLSSSFVDVDVEDIVELLYLLLLEPFLCVCKLSDGTLNVKLACS